MEQTVNNFLMTPVEPFVSGTLERKKAVISSESHTDGGLIFHSKTPWIKVQSNAIPVQDSGISATLRENWVLMGGSLYLDSDGKQRMRGSFNTAYAVESNDFRPMPGIENLDVSIKGNIGLMREAKIKFKCYNLPQLEIMQVLYMTPGIGMLIEWGWSLPSTVYQSIDLFHTDETPITGRWLSKLIKTKVISGNGYYDAMFGIVSNFNITTLDDGTFDCETTVLSPSAFTVDLNFNTPSNKIGEQLVRFFEKRLANKSEVGGDLTKYAVFQNIKGDIVISTPTADEQQATRDAKNNTDSQTSGDDKIRAQVSNTNLYITWEFFEQTVNDFFAVKKTTTKSSDPYENFVINSKRGWVKDSSKGDYVWQNEMFVSNFRYYPEGKDVKEETKKSFPKLWRSFSPAEVLIPGHPGGSTKDGGFNVKDSLIPEYGVVTAEPHPFDIQDSVWLGDLRAVYLNWNTFVRDAILNSDTIVECLNKMLNRMNDSSGGVWNLELSYNAGQFSYFRVIDMNCAEVAKGIREEDIYEFKAYTKDSIAKEVVISFTIPNSLKNTVMISTNGPQYDPDVEDADKVGAFRTFVAGVQDAFAAKRARPTSFDDIWNNGLGGALPAHSTPTEAQLNASTALGNGLSKKYFEELTSEEKSACLDVIFKTRDALAKKSTTGYERTIPIPAEATVTLEGIAGFAWGNMFRVSYLPKRYTTRTVFTIKDISHKVDGTTWDTTITGMMRIVPSIQVLDATKNVADAAIQAVIGEAPLIIETKTKDGTSDSAFGGVLGLGNDIGTFQR